MTRNLPRRGECRNVSPTHDAATLYVKTISLFLFLVLCGLIVSCRRSPSETETVPPFGTWQVVSADFGGDLRQKSGFRLMITESNMEILAPTGGRKLMGSVIRISSNSIPRQIDIVKDGFQGLGIFEVDGNTMRLLIANPGKPRPTDFKGGPGNSLFILNR